MSAKFICPFCVAAVAEAATVFLCVLGVAAAEIDAAEAGARGAECSAAEQDAVVESRGVSAESVAALAVPGAFAERVCLEVWSLAERVLFAEHFVAERGASEESSAEAQDVSAVFAARVCPAAESAAGA